MHDHGVPISHISKTVQSSAKRLRPGLANFVPAVACHFCLSLPEKFSQPRNGILTQSCKSCYKISIFLSSGIEKSKTVSPKSDFLKLERLCLAQGCNCVP